MRAPTRRKERLVRSLLAMSASDDGCKLLVFRPNRDDDFTGPVSGERDGCEDGVVSVPEPDTGDVKTRRSGVPRRIDNGDMLGVSDGRYQN
jgi:hypothetical protein